MLELVDGRFQLLERIGAGGMGVVYRALDKTSGATVAFKRHEGRSGHELERAHRESEALSRLWHPAIVRHIAKGTMADGALYVAMTWVEGVSVADRLLREGFTLAEAVAMTVRLASALAAAHGADVIHRDIKPSNVLLAANDPDRPMLVDFGISRMQDAVRALTRTGAAVGTPGYMSPEQARGERNIGPATDVFGLGCLLYECATARPAYSGANAAAVIAKVLLGTPVGVHRLCPEAPPELVAIVDRMLAKDAAARFSSCAGVVAAIDSLGDLPTGPRRSARAAVHDATRISRTPNEVHCLIAAARGNPDEVTEPPSPAAQAALGALAAEHEARLVVLVTGAVIVDFIGTTRDVTCRAAMVALEMRMLLPGWSIVISSVRPDVETATDAGTQLLSRAALGAIFSRRKDLITVDASTATLLGGEFVIDQTNDDDPTLIAKK